MLLGDRYLFTFVLMFSQNSIVFCLEKNRAPVIVKNEDCALHPLTILDDQLIEDVVRSDFHLIRFTLNITGNNEFFTDSTAKFILDPFEWTLVRNDAFKLLLQLPYDFEAQSLGTLSMRIKDIDINVRQQPPDCLMKYLYHPELAEEVIRQQILRGNVFNSKEAAPTEASVCNAHLQFLDNYGNVTVFYTCCDRRSNGIINCQKIENSWWILFFLYMLYVFAFAILNIGLSRLCIHLSGEVITLSKDFDTLKKGYVVKFNSYDLVSNTETPANLLLYMINCLTQVQRDSVIARQFCTQEHGKTTTCPTWDSACQLIPSSALFLFSCLLLPLLVVQFAFDHPPRSNIFAALRKRHLQLESNLFTNIDTNGYLVIIAGYGSISFMCLIFGSIYLKRLYNSNIKKGKLKVTNCPENQLNDVMYHYMFNHYRLAFSNVESLRSSVLNVIAIPLSKCDLIRIFVSLFVFVFIVLVRIFPFIRLPLIIPCLIFKGLKHFCSGGFLNFVLTIALILLFSGFVVIVYGSVLLVGMVSVWWYTQCLLLTLTGLVLNFDDVKPYAIFVVLFLFYILNRIRVINLRIERYCTLIQQELFDIFEIEDIILGVDILSNESTCHRSYNDKWIDLIKAEFKLGCETSDYDCPEFDILLPRETDFKCREIVVMETKKKNKRHMVYWLQSNKLIYLFNKITGKSYIPRAFLDRMLLAEDPGCPGTLTSQYIKAVFELVVVCGFLAFILMITFAFGTTRNMTSQTQTLISVIGGLLPFLLEKFVVKSYNVDIKLQNSLYWKNELRYIVNTFKTELMLLDVIPPARTNRVTERTPLIHNV